MSGLGHRHRARVEGQVQRADGLSVRRGEVPVREETDGDDLPDVHVHLAPELRKVIGDERERAAQGREPLVLRTAAQVDRVALLVRVGLVHRQRVIVREREENVALDHAVVVRVGQGRHDARRSSAQGHGWDRPRGAARSPASVASSSTSKGPP